MINSLGRLFGGGKKDPAKVARPLIEKNDPGALCKAFDIKDLLCMRFTEETFNQAQEGQESTVLIIEQRNVLAYSMDALAYNILNALGGVFPENPVVCWRETQTVNGAISEEKLRSTGFKSITKHEFDLHTYFLRWNGPLQKLLTSREHKDQAQRVAYEETLNALRANYGININEFLSREKR